MQCQDLVKNLPELSAILEKDETVCPVNWALELINTARTEACGETVMCRDGLWQVQKVMQDVVTGGGQSEDMELLREMLGVMKTVGCEYVQGVAGLVLASMDRYADEWDIHLRRKRCTALACKSYYTVHVDPAKCTGNGKCIAVCPHGAIAGGDGLISVVDNDKCTRCGECYAVCPQGAIIKAGAVKPKVPEEPVAVGSFEEGAAGGRRRRRG